MTTADELKRTGAASRRTSTRRCLFEQVTVPSFDTAHQWYGNSCILGANALIGASSALVATTSMFKIGQQVFIVDNSPSAESLTIQSVGQNTSVTFTSALLDNYTTAANARLVAPIDALEFGHVTICCWANQATATNGLTVEQSVNGTHWDYISEWTTVASTEFSASIQLIARYVQVGFLYNALPTVFRMGAYLAM